MAVIPESPTGDDIEALEDTPLLPSDGQPKATPHPNHPHFYLVAATLIAAIFFVEIGDYMAKAPVTRALEDIICRTYYESHADYGIDLAVPIPEGDCKVPAIQSELALFKGWDITLSVLPALFVAIPYGAMADNPKYGRKFVFVLGSIGIWLGCVWMFIILWFAPAIDYRWAWAGNLFSFIGGGSVVLKSMLYAMVSDVASEDQRASVFFQVHAFGVISTVFGIPLGWGLMKSSPFTAMAVGYTVVGLALSLIFLIPETLKDAAPSLYAEDEQIEAASATKSTVKERILNFVETTKESYSIFKVPMLRLLSITFLVQNLAYSTNEFLFQLASTRFHWSLGSASFIIPIGSVANFLVCLVALPVLYHLLTTKLGVSSMIKDLIVVRGSLFFIIIGSFFIAWAPIPPFYIIGILLMACGAGFGGAFRSLVTSLVHPDEVSRLYALMATADTIGMIIYGPILSKGFGLGMSIGGSWNGMVFVFVGIMFTVMGLPVWLVREPTPEMDVHG